VSETLAWVLIATWIVISLLSVGYYTLAGNPSPYRPAWYRLGSMVTEITAVWLALRVIF
jgi:hypothetical protein